MEHRLIQGGEQFLPFARSCITKLKKLGLPYANQSFEIDGVSVKVRVEPGHEYIRIEGGGAYASAFPTVQVPESVAGSEKVKLRGAKVKTGVFPATPTPAGHVDGWYGGKTWFGTSPYSSHYLRMSRPTYEPTASSASDVWFTQHSALFMDGVMTEEIHGVVTYDGEYSSGDYVYVDGSLFATFGKWGDSWSQARSEVAHCINSSNIPVLATMETSASYAKGSDYFSTSVIESPDDGLGDYSEFATRSTGRSFIKIRMVVDGSVVTHDVANLPYSYAHGARVDGANGRDGVYSDSFSVITNDFECTWNHRRWHAIDRTSVSPERVVFVLRETNEISRHVKVLTYIPTTPTDPIYENSVVRGYSLSFVTPQGSIHNHIMTADIGRHGYIEAVIPSADNKKVYVYYGIHDDSYPIEDTVDTFDVRAPVNYKEKLDEYSITVSEDGVYTLSKTRTISLGDVTLRTWDVERPQLDHFASKLHGAALVVNGFIWSDRYCYEVETNAFYEIPNYDELVPDVYHGEVNVARDQITGPRNDRSSYIVTEASGLSATYFLIGFSKVRKFKLSSLDDKGSRTITLAWNDTITGGYSIAELLSATSIKFTEPRKAK